jgi:hypothetical protein
VLLRPVTQPEREILLEKRLTFVAVEMPEGCASSNPATPLSLRLSRSQRVANSCVWDAK